MCSRRVLRCWQGVLQGGFCAETPRIPQGGHSWFQVAPTDPSQGTTEGASGKVYVRKRKKNPKPKKELKRVRNSLVNAKAKEGGQRGGVGGASSAGAGIPLQPREKTMLEQVDVPRRNLQEEQSLSGRTAACGMD